MRIVFLIIVLLPQWAYAGAWPRGEGKAFWSFATRFSGVFSPFDSFYLEAGATERMTYQLELARGSERTAMSALTWHLAESDSTWQYAAGFGYGLLSGDYAVRAHANWGRGWQWEELSGWFTIDNSISRSYEGDTVYKLDFTLGNNGEEGLNRFAQLFMSWDQQGQISHSVEFHVAQPINDTFIIDLGVRRSFTEPGDFGLAAGFWANF